MKYIITICVTAVIVFLGATIYFKGLPTFPLDNKVPVATLAPSATATPLVVTTVKAGGILVFHAYTIDVPTDWIYAKEAAPTGDIAIDKLILTKAGYKITLYQAATGGAPCLYPGDPDQEGPSSRFVSFVNITTATGDKLRRGVVESGGTGFTVCELQSGGYGEPTSFGHISIVTPAIPTQVDIDQIDSILSSLRKI